MTILPLGLRLKVEKATTNERDTTMSETTKLTNEQLSDMSPWDIADHYGIGYSGDLNPIEHGGYFYSIEEWDKWGYASCVEFWEDPETHALVVQTGTINKPDSDEEMESAFLCSGFDGDGDSGELRDNVHVQIECVKGYMGMEPDGTCYPHLKSFRLEDWKERNIWKSIRAWIEDLGR